MKIEYLYSKYIVWLLLFKTKSYDYDYSKLWTGDFWEQVQSDDVYAHFTPLSSRTLYVTVEKGWEIKKDLTSTIRKEFST